MVTRRDQSSLNDSVIQVWCSSRSPLSPSLSCFIARVEHSVSEGMVYGQSMIAVGLRRGDRDAHCGRRSISHQILLMSVELWVGGAGKSLVSRGTGSSKLEEEEEGAGVLLVIAAVMYLTGDQQQNLMGEK